MTDSDTESFHSAVDSISDCEDSPTGNINLRSNQIDGRRDEREEMSGHEFSGTAEVEFRYCSNTEVSNSILADREKQTFGDLSPFERSLKCKDVPARRYDNLSVSEFRSDLGSRKIKPREELKESDVRLGQRSVLAISECPTSQCSEMEIKTRSRPGSDRASHEIPQKNKKSFEIDEFKGGRMKEFGTDSSKISKSGDRSFEQKRVPQIATSLDKVSIPRKVGESQEKTTVDYCGWDDWELEYPGKEQSQMQRSDGENHAVIDSDSKTECEAKEMRISRSFWDWTEFGEVVTAVGEGLTNISNVVGSGFGLPTPEELAKDQSEKEEPGSSSIKSYSKLFAGLGANVVTSSLDVLEALGKKTFEKLTVPEQGSEKRRFIFEPERGQNLSEVLRELRENRAEETAFDTSCVTKRELTFIDFFEKFSGMFHLEGLEMLSKNYLRKIPLQKRREVDEIFAEDLANTLEEYQENEPEDFLKDFEEILLAIALPYNVRLVSGSSLIDSYKRCQKHLEKLPNRSDQIFELFLECLADFTAQIVQAIHKLGQLLLITTTAVKQKPFSEFHDLIGRQISLFSNQFAHHINAVDTSSEEIEELVTTVFLAAGDAFSYVQQSFRLLRPLLIS
uniref:Protein FAM114A2 n=1 Tax=Setaria digitata TaxID=48799 RepID=A0A915PKS2_9BILA